MTSVQDRIKYKRLPPCDTWSTREKLCLASSVLKSGDQNWMSVSRSLKSIVEKETLRPPDWYSQKSCALQYAHLLENADVPKRKKRESGETIGESIVRKLTQERIVELNKILAIQRDEYQQIKSEFNLLKSGSISEDKLQKMWQTIEQEEREQEQKAKADNAWLTKKEQKQEKLVSQCMPFGNQRKVSDTIVELPEISEPSTEDEEKKNKGGRSPLLTSLLKSPSPTTQIQTSTSSAQISSPTITSLLGSSPKIPNPPLTETVSSPIHQLVPTSITSVMSERPSVGAPTLSMLLEMPANTQRSPLPNLQVPSTIVSQQNVNTETRTIQPQPIPQVTIQNKSSTTVSVPITISGPTNIPVTESMVQIMDHIDDVIRKDIIADVMDKDEINEIIGDIEELIKEEITGSPQTVNTTSTNAVINSLTISQAQGIPQIPEHKPEPRNVDEAVSLSDSPRSEIAIEEIDSSTSNIAEIIGTVAIEPSEPKVVVTDVPQTMMNVQKETKSGERPSEKKAALKEKVVSKIKTNDENSNNINENIKKEIPEEKPVVQEFDVLKPTSNIKTEETDLKTPEIKEAAESVAKEEVEKVEKVEVDGSVKEKSNDSIKKQKGSTQGSENKECTELDQLELHLAKITGEQQEVQSSAEATSVSSEVTNDVPSTEDTEKSQDISLILEDDENSHSGEEKKKVSEENIIEKTVESTVSLEREPVVLTKEKALIEVGDELSVKSQEKVPEDNLELYTDESKKQDTKDSSEDTSSSILQGVEVKEEVDECTVPEESNHKSPEEAVNIETRTPEVIKSEEVSESKQIEDVVPTIKEEPKEEEVITPQNVELELNEKEIKKEEAQVKEEKDVNKRSVENEQIIKKESVTTEPAAGTTEEPGELDEEESSLSKLSSGRTMKTYSKKQTVAMDSEPENETIGEGADYRAWKKAVMLVYNRLATHKYASVFLRPITEDQAPGYHSVIFRPMDLSTIKKNIDNGTIRSTMHFQRDVMLMFQNAIMYNKHDTFIYKMAISMQEECLQHMQILVQATGEGSFRRETRTAASSSSSSEASESSVKRKRSHITPSPHDTESPRSKKRRKSEND